MIFFIFLVKIIFPGPTGCLGLGVRRFLHVEDEEAIMRLAGGKLGAACDGMPETFITIIYIMSNPMSHSQNAITFFVALDANKLSLAKECYCTSSKPSIVAILTKDSGCI